MRQTIIMHPQTMASDSSHSDSRYTVADILSSMANGGSTPSTLGNFEGFSTGVLTQTTPTLTPTTLRNIEQTFIELQTVPPQQVQHQNQAGFVTPIVNPPIHSSSSNTMLITSAPASISPPASTYHSVSTKSYSSDSSSNSASSPPPWSTESYSSGAPSTGTVRKVTGRNMGGRRPAKHEKLSPEEEERRRVRRERNKLAAARCRKRRLDHTNCLVNETDHLEEIRSELQLEIRELNSQREELEFILETHKVVCKLQKHSHGHGGVHSSRQEPSDVKPVVSDLNVAPTSSCATSSSTSTSSNSCTFFGATKEQPKRPDSLPLNKEQPKRNDSLLLNKEPPKRPDSLLLNTTIRTSNTFGSAANMPVQRPSSLELTSTFLPPPRPMPTMLPSTSASGKRSLTEDTGITISTPSNGIFNFEALMDGGTGLTPVSSGTGLTPMIPTCSTQQRSSGSDLASPDTVTPTKLVSL